jgi:hypothetical protein
MKSECRGFIFTLACATLLGESGGVRGHRLWCTQPKTERLGFVFALARILQESAEGIYSEAKTKGERCEEGS